MSRTTPTHARTRARGFNLVELLIALAISASLLTATLQALDASWRGYRHVSESASTHVVSRIVVHRLLTMIRTGTDFSPFPADVLDSDQNPMASNSIQFTAEEDRIAGNLRLTRIERREATGENGPFEIWYVLLDNSTNPPTVTQERPLMRNVQEATFILEYEPGPRLRRATIDLTVRPNDDRAIRVNIGDNTEPLRFVASAVPRQLQ